MGSCIKKLNVCFSRQGWTRQSFNRMNSAKAGSWTTIACSWLTTSTSSTKKYLAPHQPCSKPDTVLVNTLLNNIKCHEQIHNFVFFV